jgi:hypothetical protein
MPFGSSLTRVMVLPGTSMLGVWVSVVVNHLHIRFGWLIEPEVILGRD